nr:MAG TPA: VP3 protein [Inoviridae sp.]
MRIGFGSVTVRLSGCPNVFTSCDTIFLTEKAV